jgi:RND superfamily putative drug exporter
MAVWSARRPWVVVGAWALVLVASFVIVGALLSSAISTEIKFVSNPDSKVGTELIDESSLAGDNYTDTVTVSNAELTVNDPAFEERVESLTSEIRAVEAVEATTNFYETDNPNFVSESGSTTIIPMAIPVDVKDDVTETLAIVEEENGEGGFALTHSGQATLDHDFNEQSEKDLQRGESIGIGVALIILLLVFGTVVAGVLPILLAIISIIIGLGVVSVLGQFAEFSFFVVNLMTMMGLAVGIDYSLFIVSRYREEREAGKDKLGAIEASGGTANKAVLFSGITVVVSLAGLLLVPNTIFISLGAGAIIVVIITILQAQTLLPAVLSIVGDGINRLKVPFISTQYGAEAEVGFFSGVARRVQQHPVVSLVVTTLILLAAAAPLLTINTGFSGVSTLPDGFASKEGFEVLAEEFDAGQSSPAQVVINGNPTTPEVTVAVEQLRRSIAEDPGFGPATALAVSDDRTVGLVQAPLASDPQTQDAYDAVNRLRDDAIPAAFAGTDVEVLVTGQTAEDVDFIAQLGDFTVPVIALVLVLSMILLTLAFRSIVIAIKSILVTLLSVLAAYGIVVLVWQHGVGNEIFGFQQVEKIEVWIPLFVFALLFGLSMDYQVFLVSRIQERYTQTGDNDEAVRWGVGTTARLITGAAAIMVAVFGGFALGELVALSQMGFALAVAIAIDALIVRTILVPAAMTLLGDWNWYLPSWLEWLPDIKIEGEPLQEPEPEQVGAK